MDDAATLRTWMEANHLDTPAAASLITGRARRHDPEPLLLAEARRRARYRDRAACLLTEILEGEPVTPEHAAILELALRPPG